MSRIRPVLAASTLWLALAATSAHAAQATQTAVVACVGAQEAEGLVTVLAPDLIRQVGVTCAEVLPPTALVRQTSGAFLDRYQAAADDAWPKGKAALARLAGAQAAGIMDSAFARPLIATMMVPLLTKTLKPKDCPAIDRMLTLMAPLPPRNVAALAVEIFQLAADDRAAKGQKSAISICPDAAGR